VPRSLILAAAQLGPIARDEPRSSAVTRMVALMREAHQRGANVVVFPELALTTFFPRWYIQDEAELDAFYETEMPNDATQPLFDCAAELGVGFYLGYAELLHDATGAKRRFNTSIIVDGTGVIVGKYRKIHLPGHHEHEAWRPFQHLEKRYFEHGDLGFPVFEAFGGVIGMCICNDRRWPETFRVLGLRGAQNGCWVVGVAKAGREEDCDLIGGSCIIAPTGEIIARTQGFGDELALAEIDLDRCAEIRRNIFNFALHREPGNYGPICAPKG